MNMINKVCYSHHSIKCGETPVLFVSVAHFHTFTENQTNI